MSYFYESDEPAEHECPTALERPVTEMDVTGLVFTPAGRWETITDRTPHGEIHAQVTLTTDRCVWTLWRSDKLPYIDGWRAGQRRYVLVNEIHTHMEIVVGAQRGFGSRGHVLAMAQQVRGSGWTITDRPTGAGEVEYVTVDSKAKARTEMRRRAKAHARRLGMQVWREGGAL